MKKLFVIGLLLAGAHAFAHDHAPERVRMSFVRTFPGVKTVHWEIEKGKYEAHFKHRGQKTSALFDKTGAWLETEREIDVFSLPPEATLYIEQHFKGKIPRHASVITRAGGETQYEAHLNSTDYIFDANGKFLKAERD